MGHSPRPRAARSPIVRPPRPILAHVRRLDGRGEGGGGGGGGGAPRIGQKIWVKG